MSRFGVVRAAFLALFIPAVAFAQTGPDLLVECGSAAAAANPDVPCVVVETVVVTARRIEETVQEVPIPVSVLGADLVADAGAFNVNRLKELVPTVQFYSSNPRNSTINIRGLG